MISRPSAGIRSANSRKEWRISAQVLKEVQMVLPDVEDYAHSGVEGQETVGVLAGLRDKIGGMAHPDIAANAVQHTPTETVGSQSPASRISVIMEVVVVFPWVPDTATAVG